MRRLTLLATPLVALALAGNASAETRTHSIGQQEVTTPTFNFSCRPYGYAFILTQDFVAGTTTNSGLIRESWSPSGDFIALRLGEVVTNTATGAVLSVSSPLAAGPQYQQAVCGYLAGL